jgi:hypothetical protein
VFNRTSRPNFRNASKVARQCYRDEDVLKVALRPDDCLRSSNSKNMLSARGPESQRVGTLHLDRISGNLQKLAGYCYQGEERPPHTLHQL